PLPHPSLFPYTTLFRSLSGPAVFGFTVSNGDLVLQQARDAEFHVSTYAHALHQDVPNVVSLNVDDRTVHVGSHQLIPDEESGEPDRKSTRLNSSHVSTS